jgi:hypothetical protein
MKIGKQEHPRKYRPEPAIVCPRCGEKIDDEFEEFSVTGWCARCDSKWLAIFRED